MKISDKLANRQPKERSYSFEYFCPKTEQGVFNLIDRIDRMVKLRPLFVDITWNAGGSSSADTTLELVEVVEREIKMDTCMHMTCVGMSEEEVDTALKSAYDAGCRTILALRGDPPVQRSESDGSDVTHSRFPYAKDLIHRIRKNYGSEVSIGVAGYPEGHPEETDPQTLIRYLKEKVDAGADFIVTQMFYDVDIFVQWCHDVRAAGISVPIIPGIMPISGWSSFLRRAKWCQINLPQRWVAELEALSHDDAAVRSRGTELVAEMCREIMARTDVDHLHFYTMNLEKSSVMCLEALDLLKEEESVDPETVDAKISGGKPVGGSATLASMPTQPRRHRLRRPSSLSTVKPIYWRNRPTSYLSRTTDEFPNGRLGDPRSPAYNQLNELEILLKVSSASARKLWGHPTSAKDVGRSVQMYIKGELKSLPWSDSPAAEEVSVINNELLRLNDGHIDWFTINSQPAVSGIKSEDHVLGWGPAHGYVYQKAYIELMVHPEVWASKLLPRLQKLEHWQATYYAVESKTQNLITNAEPDEVNAITWGIFPGEKVVQPTIVEGTSFLAWKDEAFRIALEWARCYPKDTEPAQFLTQIAKDWVLVNLVHHDYYEPNALFEILDL